MELQGKVVIITGASSGIGATTARGLARNGATVVLAARRANVLERLRTEIERDGGRALAVPTDIAQRAEIDQLVRKAYETYGRIDVLVNNAGIGAGSSVSDGGDETIRQIIDVNLLAPARCIQAVLPYIKQQGGGVIVNIGSVAGEIGTTGLYSATKFGLRGLNDALRREFRRDKIAVVLIEPGFIRTNMTAGLPIPMPGPEIIARAVADVIRRPRRKLIVPWPYAPLMYFAKLFPGLTDWLLGGSLFQKTYEKRRKGY